MNKLVVFSCIVSLVSLSACDEDQKSANGTSANIANRVDGQAGSNAEPPKDEEPVTLNHGDVISSEDLDKVKLEAGDIIAECSTNCRMGWCEKALRFFK